MLYAVCCVGITKMSAMDKNATVEVETDSDSDDDDWSFCKYCKINFKSVQVNIYDLSCFINQYGF